VISIDDNYLSKNKLATPPIHHQEKNRKMAGNHHRPRKGHGNPPGARNGPYPHPPSQPRAAEEGAKMPQPPTGPRAMQVVPTPHPSFIQVAKPYVFEHTIQECLAATEVDPQREDNVRISGVTWIDNVRKALHLYVSF
jgi:CTD kinase subunit beta